MQSIKKNIEFYETSAKIGTRVDEAFICLAKKLMFKKLFALFNFNFSFIIEIEWSNKLAESTPAEKNII